MIAEQERIRDWIAERIEEVLLEDMPDFEEGELRRATRLADKILAYLRSQGVLKWRELERGKEDEPDEVWTM